MFIGHLYICGIFKNWIACSWFYLLFPSGDFIFFLLISNDFLCIKDINNALFSRLQIFFLSLLWAFWVYLLAPNLNLVSSWERAFTDFLLLARKIICPLKFGSYSTSQAFQLFPEHVPEGFPQHSLRFSFQKGTHTPWRWFPSIFVLEFSASHKRVRFSSRFLTFPLHFCLLKYICTSQPSLAGFFWPRM